MVLNPSQTRPTHLHHHLSRPSEPEPHLKGIFSSSFLLTLPYLMRPSTAESEARPASSHRHARSIQHTERHASSIFPSCKNSSRGSLLSKEWRPCYHVTWPEVRNFGVRQVETYKLSPRRRSGVCCNSAGRMEAGQPEMYTTHT
jgi:hypothetical protein